MDVEKLIQAAKICADPEGKCDECSFTDKCTCGMWPAEILEIRDHYEQKLMLLREDINLLQRTMQTHKNVIADYKRQLEESKALLKAERSKVIAEVREWAIENACGTPVGNRLMAMLYSMELDSMEADDGR